MRRGRVVTLAFAVLLAARAAAAQQAFSGDSIAITRASGPIAIDGDLSDPAWRTAVRIDKWYEKQPGDNTEPKVKNVGYLTFDDRYLYAAFEFDDPNPAAIRAPFADRDNINGNANDYAGILLDARNTGSNAAFFLVTPRNTQYDAITDDSSGEDASPDFFWDSAAKITEHGWSVSAQFDCLNQLWIHESNWKVYATNPSSGAYGMPQSLPGNKMAAAGSDWQTNPATQIEWGEDYIKSRYSTPCAAWSFWQAQSPHWY